MEINESLLYHLVGQHLKQRRLERGLTQEEVARAASILRTSLTNIEAGRQRMPLHTLYRLCLVLQIDVSAVLPSASEVQRTLTVDVHVDGTVQSVPPKAAAFLQQLLGEGGEDEQPSESEVP